VSHHNSERVVITPGLVAGDVIHLTMPSGTKEPQFEQPALPEPAQPAPEPAAAPENGGADSPGVATAPGERGPGNRGPGGGNRKAYPEMTPDELQDSKQRLLAMVDRLRDQMEAEQATRLEKSVADIVKAIDENRLDEAQTLRDAMRSLMPRRPNGAQRPSGDREDRER
jgi:hypothetical protein